MKKIQRTSDSTANAIFSGDIIGLQSCSEKFNIKPAAFKTNDSSTHVTKATATVSIMQAQVNVTDNNVSAYGEYYYIQSTFSTKIGLPINPNKCNKEISIESAGFPEVENIADGNVYFTNDTNAFDLHIKVKFTDTAKPASFTMNAKDYFIVESSNNISIKLEFDTFGFFYGPTFYFNIESK